MSQVLLLYDAVDTGTDAKLVVDLFKAFHYAWGVVAIFSILFGLFNFTIGVAELVPDSILKKFPLKSVVIRKKNLITGIFAVNSERGDRLENLWVYLLVFKLPEDLPYAVLRLFQHDREKDIFYMIRTVTTIIGLCVALMAIGYVIVCVGKAMPYLTRMHNDLIRTHGLTLICSFGFLVVAFLFIVSVIILSCLALGSRIVLSFGIRIIFDAVLVVLGIFTVWFLREFLTDSDREPDDIKTCFDVVKEKMCCKCVDIEPETVELDSL